MWPRIRRNIKQLIRIRKGNMSEESQSLTTMMYYGGEQPRPGLNQNHLRMYVHALCPFAQRAQMAMTLSGVQYQQVQTELEDKAAWHKDINGGLIPILETPQGELITESGVLMELADDLRIQQGLSAPSLWPACPYAKAQMRLQMKKYDGLMMGIFGVFMTRGQDQEKIDALKAALPHHEALCQAIPKGDTLSMLDVHCFPLWEKMIMWEQSSWGDAFEALQIMTLAPSVYEYVYLIRSNPALKDVLPRQESVNLHLAKWRSLPQGVKQQLKTQFVA